MGVRAVLLRELQQLSLEGAHRKSVVTRLAFELVGSVTISVSSHTGYHAAWRAFNFAPFNALPGEVDCKLGLVVR